MKIITLSTSIIGCVFRNNFEDLQSHEVVQRIAKTVVTHVSSVSRINELLNVEGLTCGKVCSKEK